MYKPMEQIQKDYNGRWVYMVNCEKNERGSVIGGEVVLHSESRAGIFQRMKQVNKGNSQTFIGYVGELPKGVAFL